MEFVQLFLPMVENEEITGSMRGDGDHDPVSEFIGEYFINAGLHFLENLCLTMFFLMFFFYSSL